VRRGGVIALAAVGVLWPALLVAGRWPQWWEWIAPELTPMTWLQSVILVVAGAGALLVAVVLRLAGVPAVGRRIWWLLGAGFGALAVDERFALHERVRDGWLAPRGVEIPFLPWVAAGDFLVLGIAAIGLLLLPQVWAAVSPDPGARAALVVAVSLALVAVGVDSIDPSTWTVQQERFQQTAEEVVELWCGLALLTSVALRLLGLLQSHVPSERASAAQAERTTAGHPEG